jgi:hypothetical protein
MQTIRRIIYKCLVFLAIHLLVSSAYFICLFLPFVLIFFTYSFHLFFPLLYPWSYLKFICFFFWKKSKPKSNKKKAFFYILTQKKVAEEEKFDGNLRHIVKNIFNIPYIVSNHEIGEKNSKSHGCFTNIHQLSFLFFLWTNIRRFFFLS